MNQAAKTRVVNSSRAKHSRRAAEAAMRLSKRRMWLEQLEDRAMMATFNVSASVADGAAGSLRAALTTAVPLALMLAA